MTDRHEDGPHGGHEAHHHIVPLSIYFGVFGTLMVMTAITVAVAYVDLGPPNIFVALGIAVFKASLVVLYFMHVKYASKLTQLAAVTGFVWLAILIGFTYSDVGTRDWVGASDGWTLQPLDETAVPDSAPGRD